VERTELPHPPRPPRSKKQHDHHVRPSRRPHAEDLQRQAALIRKPDRRRNGGTTSSCSGTRRRMARSHGRIPRPGRLVHARLDTHCAASRFCFPQGPHLTDDRGARMGERTSRRLMRTCEFSGDPVSQPKVQRTPCSGPTQNAIRARRLRTWLRDESKRLRTLPEGSRTKNRRTPQGSSVKGWTISHPRR
jgi:hypothetical protein